MWNDCAYDLCNLVVLLRGRYGFVTLIEGAMNITICTNRGQFCANAEHRGLKLAGNWNPFKIRWLYWTRFRRYVTLANAKSCNYSAITGRGSSARGAHSFIRSISSNSWTYLRLPSIISKQSNRCTVAVITSQFAPHRVRIVSLVGLINMSLNRNSSVCLIHLTSALESRENGFCRSRLTQWSLSRIFASIVLLSAFDRLTPHASNSFF